MSKVKNYIGSFLPDGGTKQDLIGTVVVIFIILAAWWGYQMFTAKPAPTSNDPSGFPGTSISQSDAKGYYNKGLGKCFVLISFTENAPKANGINYYKVLYDGVAHTKIASDSELVDTTTHNTVQHICSITSPNDPVIIDCSLNQFDQFVASKMSN